MATETNDEREREQQESTKFQQAQFIRYHPEQGRADKLAANIPGFKGENS